MKEATKDAATEEGHLCPWVILGPDARSGIWISIMQPTWAYAGGTKKNPHLSRQTFLARI